jgi:hypothetical protein
MLIRLMTCSTALSLLSIFSTRQALLATIEEFLFSPAVVASADAGKSK